MPLTSEALQSFPATVALAPGADVIPLLEVPAAIDSRRSAIGVGTAGEHKGDVRG